MKKAYQWTVTLLSIEVLMNIFIYEHVKYACHESLFRQKWLSNFDALFPYAKYVEFIFLLQTLMTSIVLHVIKRKEYIATIRVEMKANESKVIFIPFSIKF